MWSSCLYWVSCRVNGSRFATMWRRILVLSLHGLHAYMSAYIHIYTHIYIDRVTPHIAISNSNSCLLVAPIVPNLQSPIPYSLFLPTHTFTRLSIRLFLQFINVLFVYKNICQLFNYFYQSSQFFFFHRNLIFPIIHHSKIYQLFKFF